MPTAEQVAQAARRYAETISAGDRDGWLAGFTEDAELVEPANSAPRQGRSVFAGIFDAIQASGRRIALRPIRSIVNGNEVAVHMDVRVFLADGRVVENSVIEIFGITDDGRIARLRTFLDSTSGAAPDPRLSQDLP
ncbi:MULTISPECIES: nuclear transport factor 2 family protein [unclassified Caballeronia]|uniref:nuclear transport factor 2 family protein n=1 Tax=unclassified Caballeronia TaxID=2646786 RepID=UPI002858AEE9|nr:MULTISPECIES: nuclear transport factor 2 family protein [unclassified Caballeronia]MDR5777306.1 nuclear transport factor 2 family protein [Caballeronia sp. LZ002]MDR5852762.1 nuclear transport factor 2 family protein [Caballeronia sp. LZ003]